MGRRVLRDRRDDWLLRRTLRRQLRWREIVPTRWRDRSVVILGRDVRALVSLIRVVIGIRGIAGTGLGVISRIVRLSGLLRRVVLDRSVVRRLPVSTLLPSWVAVRIV